MATYTFVLDKDQQKTWTRHICFQWVGLVVWTVVASLLGIKFGTCEDGPPAFLFYVIAAYIVGLGTWQLWLLTGKVTGFLGFLSLLLSIALGLAETADNQSDVQQLALAVLCDSEYHEIWVRSFDSSCFWFLGGVAAQLHIYGIMTISLVISTVLIGVLLLGTYQKAGTSPAELAGVCTFVGLGGIAAALGLEERERLAVVAGRAGLVVLWEVVPQALLGPSQFALLFEHATQASKQKQLVALSLTALSLCKAVVDGATVLHYFVMQVDFKKVPCFGRMVNVVFVPCAILGCVFALLLGIARVDGAYTCDSHIYNLFVGCARLTNATV